MSRERLEKEIESWVIQQFPEALALKTHKRDWPDRLFLLPGGRCFFVEFKREGKDLRPGQRLAKAALEARGFKVFKIDTVDAGKLLLDSWSLTNDNDN